VRANDDRAVYEAAWREQEGHGYEQPDQAVVAARLHELGRSGNIGPALYRRCGGQNSRSMVDPGLRPGRGHLVQKSRRRLRKGERQKDRLQHHSLCPDAPEDRVGSHQRHRARLFQSSPIEAIALLAWENKLVDVSDVIATQKEKYTETALLSAFCYNKAGNRRSCYGVPYTTAVLPNHAWKSLVEKAGS